MKTTKEIIRENYSSDTPLNQMDNPDCVWFSQEEIEKVIRDYFDCENNPDCKCYDCFCKNELLLKFNVPPTTVDERSLDQGQRLSVVLDNSSNSGVLEKDEKRLMLLPPNILSEKEEVMSPTVTEESLGVSSSASSGGLYNCKCNKSDCERCHGLDSVTFKSSGGNNNKKCQECNGDLFYPFDDYCIKCCADAFGGRK